MVYFWSHNLKMESTYNREHHYRGYKADMRKSNEHYLRTGIRLEIVKKTPDLVWDDGYNVHEEEMPERAKKQLKCKKQKNESWEEDFDRLTPNRDGKGDRKYTAFYIKKYQEMQHHFEMKLMWKLYDKFDFFPKTLLNSIMDEVHFTTRDYKANELTRIERVLPLIKKSSPYFVMLCLQRVLPYDMAKLITSYFVQIPDEPLLWCKEDISQDTRYVNAWLDWHMRLEEVEKNIKNQNDEWGNTKNQLVPCSWEDLCYT